MCLVEMDVIYEDNIPASARPVLPYLCCVASNVDVNKSYQSSVVKDRSLL